MRLRLALKRSHLIEPRGGHDVCFIWGVLGFLKRGAHAPLWGGCGRLFQWHFGLPSARAHRGGPGAHARSSRESLHVAEVAAAEVSSTRVSGGVGMECIPLLLLLSVAGRLRARHADSFLCTLGDFSCDNGDPVPLCLRCDRTPDCRDGSDERGCSTGNVSCGPHGRQCGNRGPCLPFERFCDGHANCPDAFDESIRVCGSPASALRPPRCRKDAFRCAPGAECFPVTWVCDGHPDCPDERDELGCTLDFPSTTETSPTMSGTESAESPEGVKMDHWTIIAIVALLILVMAGVAVSAWVCPRAKPVYVSFRIDKASEQLMTKELP
uniref:CD320 antigen n=1 Tax=Pogona vitticeps TaxID=103695 RepID=A0A6J0SNK4_9SAUR